MKPFRYLTFIFALILGLFALAATPALAGKKTPVDEPPPDVRKVVKAVDVAKSTISIVNMRPRASKVPKVYTIDSMTALKVNNQKATLSEVKVGMVLTEYMERDNDTLDSAEIDTDTSAPPDTGKKKK